MRKIRLVVRTVPMFLAGGDQRCIAYSDLDFLISGTYKSRAFGDVKDLVAGVSVEFCPRASVEVYDVEAVALRVALVDEWVHHDLSAFKDIAVRIIYFRPFSSFDYFHTRLQSQVAQAYTPFPRRPTLLYEW